MNQVKIALPRELLSQLLEQRTVVLVGKSGIYKEAIANHILNTFYDVYVADGLDVAIVDVKTGSYERRVGSTYYSNPNNSRDLCDKLNQEGTIPLVSINEVFPMEELINSIVSSPGSFNIATINTYDPIPELDAVRVKPKPEELLPTSVTRIDVEMKSRGTGEDVVQLTYDNKTYDVVVRRPDAKRLPMDPVYRNKNYLCNACPRSGLDLILRFLEENDDYASVYKLLDILANVDTKGTVEGDCIAIKKGENLVVGRSEKMRFASDLLLTISKGDEKLCHTGFYLEIVRAKKLPTGIVYISPSFQNKVITEMLNSLKENSNG